MKNFWTKLPKPFFALAPMAGYTDQPFRLMCKSFGADVVYSEMVSSEALFHNAISNFKFLISNQISNAQMSKIKTLQKTFELIRFSQIERPFVVQIFGANPEHMAYAAEYIASGKWEKDYRRLSTNNLQHTIQKKLRVDSCRLNVESIPSGIDVNMGCPTRDVVKTGAGAALLKNPQLAIKIIKAIKKRIKNIPISVKTRLGWNNSKNILIFCRMLEDAGADALAIHGRTYRQGFSGPVDWKMIAQVKKAVKIPVIGNGAVATNSHSGLACPSKLQRSGNPESIKILKPQVVEQVHYGARQVQDDKIDGIMIGTGALGKPWFFNEIKTSCHSGLDPESQRSRNEFGMTKDKIRKNILKHTKLVQEIKGERGIIEFRKHLAWYLKGLPGIKEIKKQLVKVSSYYEIEEILSKKCSNINGKF